MILIFYYFYNFFKNIYLGFFVTMQPKPNIIEKFSEIYK